MMATKTAKRCTVVVVMIVCDDSGSDLRLNRPRLLGTHTYYLSMPKGETRGSCFLVVLSTTHLSQCLLFFFFLFVARAFRGRTSSAGHFGSKRTCLAFVCIGLCVFWRSTYEAAGRREQSARLRDRSTYVSIDEKTCILILPVA